MRKCRSGCVGDKGQDRLVHEHGHDEGKLEELVRRFRGIRGVVDEVELRPWIEFAKKRNEEPLPVQARQ